MKKFFIILMFMFCLTGVTLPAVTAYAEERAVVAVPSKPTVTNIVDSIRVRWTAVDGVQKYGIWRSETGKNGTYKWLGNPTQNSYQDKNVVSGTTYFYKITCMDPNTGAHGAKSEAGGVAYVSTPDITQRFNKAAGVVLQWNKIDGATGYGIYRKSYDGTDAWVRIATITGNNTFTYTDAEVKDNNGTVYRYTVRALAGADRKTLSGCRNTGRTMVRLTSRTLSSATATAYDSIKCSWTTTTQATGYEVRFMVGSTVVRTVTIGNYKTGVKTFTGLTPETTYKVQVRSYKKVDGVGSFYSAWSEAKMVTTPADPNVTATPKPTATATPKPTPTATPKPTATPSPIATPTPAPLLGKFPEVVAVNAYMNADFLDSEEKVNRYLLEHLMSYYRTIYLYAEDISMLHTAEEYMAMYPGMIMEAEIRSLTKYINGYQMQINVSKCPEIDMEHIYTIVTGDTSYLDEKELAAYEKLLEINEALNLEGKSDIDKIVAVHDYLLLNVAYDEVHLETDNNPDAHYVEGTILQGKAVCSGYASTFRLFMLLQGINCEYVSNNGHAWNLIELDGEWYHMDVTWDDPVPDVKGRVLYTHFMMTDEMLATLDSHDNWECECGKEHVCDDDSYILYPYREYVCTTVTEAIAVAEKQADNDSIYFVYPMDGVLDRSKLFSILRGKLGFSAITYYPEKQMGDYYFLRIIN